MLTKASWIKVAMVTLLGVVLCTGTLSCSFGCTPLMRGCVGIPGAAIGVLADYENVGNGSVDAAQVKAIELDWAAGHVVFEEYDVAYDGGKSIESKILLEEGYTGSADDSYRMRWEVSDGVLRIAYCASGGGVVGCTPLNWPDKTLTIGIPKGAGDFLQSVTIDGLSGDYALDGLKCTTLNLSLASGKAHGTDCAFGDVHVEMASGNVSLRAKVEDRLQVDATSGDFSLDCIEAMPRETMLDMTSGSMVLSVPGDASFAATVQKTSGSFNCDLSDVHRIDDAYVRGDGAAKVSVDMTSGNVTLRGNDA